ncbi:32 kDa beta-galactoside-binding lectin [Toxocara canis]|uniref:Galectin n=1 Tax=Toxocara canis TaxID=6265 RepID=A0A0B2VEA8_TOXCA|nr:32 kDa beta-galactoside-binding lectin [Toxocara canis]
MSVRDATTTAALRFCLSVLTATAVVLSICGACECDGYNHDGSKRCNCGWSSNRDGYSRHFTLELLANNDITFHMSVRFGFQRDHQIVVTSQDEGKCSAEQRFTNNIRINERRSLSILCEENRFQVIINEQEIDVFHELPLTSLTALTIKGDVAVYKITFENFNGTFPPEIPPSEGAKLPYQLNGTEFRLPTPSDRMGADRRPPITRLPPFFPTPVTDIGRQMGSDCQ